MPGIALQQAQPQPGFKVRHAPAEFGALQAQDAGGGGEAAFFHHLAKKQQVVQVVNMGSHKRETCVGIVLKGRTIIPEIGLYCLACGTPKLCATQQSGSIFLTILLSPLVASQAQPVGEACSIRQFRHTDFPWACRLWCWWTISS